MSKFDETLFARIAVLNNYVSRQELEECQRIQSARGSAGHIGHVLLEKGYISKEQFDRIDQIRSRKVRKLLRSQEESQENDREFSRLLLQVGMLDVEGLEGAVMEQQRLRQLNLHFSLAEVVISRRLLTVNQVLRVFALQGRSLLRCALCDSQYQIADYQEGERYRCPRCSAELTPPVCLDPLMVEGVVVASRGDAEGQTVVQESTM